MQNAAAAGRSNTVQLIWVGVQIFRDREVYLLMVQPRVYQQSNIVQRQSNVV